MCGLTFAAELNRLRNASVDDDGPGRFLTDGYSAQFADQITALPLGLTGTGNARTQINALVA